MNPVAVVILNWNGQKLLEKFLPAIIKFSPEATIYMADNNSDDLSVELVRVHFPSVKVIRNIGNFGFARGYNEALKFVEEDIYALVNSDIEVTENWLQPIIELFDRDQQTAIVQPKILDYKQKDQFEYAGAGGGFIDKYGYPFCRGRIFDTIEKDLGQYDDETEIFWASGACFFIRREVYRDLKGFDPGFFAHQEEIDLCWRTLNSGHKVKYCGKSTVYHIGGATLNSDDPKKTYLNFRNSLYMLTKNLPSQKLFIILFMRLIMDGAAGIRFLFSGKYEHIVSIIKAHYSFYMEFGHYYDKRSMFRQNRYYKVKNIAWAYFIDKKRFYKDLF